MYSYSLVLIRHSFYLYIYLYIYLLSILLSTGEVLVEMEYNFLDVLKSSAGALLIVVGAILGASQFVTEERYLLLMFAYLDIGMDIGI